jgi:hypothetical protein
MLQRTNKIFIGKDIDRTAALVDVASKGMEHITLTAHIVEGEIIVLDKFKRVLTAGATIADSDTIFICQGTGQTFAYTNELGTSVPVSRRVKLSDPIKGNLVKSFSGRSYIAKSEQNNVITMTGLTPVVGTEYLIRIVYKDMVEHPGQFTHTYRVIATDATLTTLIHAFDTKINAHSGRRVAATHADGVSLTLTGLPIPGCTTGLSDLDVFSMVEFDVFFNYVDADGNWAEVTTIASNTKTVANVLLSTGYWEQVRDMEKAAWGYQGITNRTLYPVILPDVQTVVSTTYDLITIEHDNDYLSPDNQYTKNFPLTTTMAFVVDASADAQVKHVLAQLNPWMASTPGAFPNVTV